MKWNDIRWHIRPKQSCKIILDQMSSDETTQDQIRLNQIRFDGIWWDQMRPIDISCYK